MDKVAKFLSKHISGEIINDSRLREYYSHDTSILQVRPIAIAYPRNTEDVQKIARFSYRLAERGIKLPITARGSGTDQTGAAIGEGIITVFPAHMDRVLELDERDRKIRIQSGLNFKALEDVLSTHGLYLPVHPTSYAISTIGGAIANNSSGDKTIKYGYLRNYVDRLEVVLSNGEVIETGRLNRNELNKKKGLATMEGDIYRQIDGLIDDNDETIKLLSDQEINSNIGYAIEKVKNSDGSFDLTPLFVGSQGTLGVISQAILNVEPIPPVTTLVAVAIKDNNDLQQIIDELMPLKPSSVDFLDETAIKMIAKITDREIYKTLSPEAPNSILMIEFDDNKSTRHAKKFARFLDQFGDVTIAETESEKEELAAMFHAVSTITQANFTGKVALPIIDDAVVPTRAVARILNQAKKLAEKKFVDVAIWGRIGAGSLTVMPFMDLARLEDRQNIIILMNRYYSEVMRLGGVIGGSRGEGRLRSVFSQRHGNEEVRNLYTKIKEIFDPQNILNPNVKAPSDVRDLITKFRAEYNANNLNDYYPRR